jgi:hypothetical protein
MMDNRRSWRCRFNSRQEGGSALTEATVPIAVGDPAHPYPFPQLSIVIPFKTSSANNFRQLAARWKPMAGSLIEVIICDGSSPRIFANNSRELQGSVRHIPVDRMSYDYKNDKVNGLCTGIRASSSKLVIICDDDIVLTPHQVRELSSLDAASQFIKIRSFPEALTAFETIEVVRSLISNCIRRDGDTLPIVMGSKVELLSILEGMEGNLLFDDRCLESSLLHSSRYVSIHPDILARRTPSSPAKWAEQQVRYAYEDIPLLAKTGLFFLSPFVAWSLAQVNLGVLCAYMAVIGGFFFAAATIGRKRANLSQHCPAWVPCLGPAWFLIRSCAVPVALGVWCMGGLKYGGRRVRWPARIRFWGW